MTTTIAPGGTATTDTEGDGATPEDPIETTVTSPAGGAVQISEAHEAGPGPRSYNIMGVAVDVTAPAATPTNPVVIAFRVDSSLVPPDADTATTVVFRDGSVVGRCQDPSGSANPDPCVSSVRRLPDNDLEMTVLSSRASTWSFGVLPRATPGLVDPTQGRWHLKSETGKTAAFYFGDPGDFPMMGDWDCDGVETPGLYRQSDGFVYLRNSNTPGVGDIRFFFGNPNDVPLAGDFDGDGCDTVSLYRVNEGRVYIINRLGADEGGLGAADLDYFFGNPADKPYVGDFDGDGVDEVGLHREATGLVYFRFTHASGIADYEYIYGDPGDRIVADDWVATGTDSPGIFRPSAERFYLRHSNTPGVADEVMNFGASDWLPVSGRFDLDP